MVELNHESVAVESTRQIFKVSEDHWSGYDLDTFLGGLMYWREVCSPEKSFHTSNTISQYQADVKAMQTEKMNEKGEACLTKAEFEAYRHKMLVLASATSPGSEKIIPWFSRTSAFVPMSVPISVGMVMSPPTQFLTIFWQVINTTYCAGLNYCNGSKISENEAKKFGPAMLRKKAQEEQQMLLRAYLMATGTALAVACPLRAIVTPYLKRKGASSAALLANYLVSYAAVTSSSCANVYAMRVNETVTGVDVKNEATGEVLGKSKIAAQEGIQRTMLSRAAYCVPMFVAPAIWNMAVSGSRLYKTSKCARVAFEVMGVAFGLYIAMPVNCALFPQQSRIKVSELEPQIQAIARNQKLQHLTYNKGL